MDSVSPADGTSDFPKCVARLVQSVKDLSAVSALILVFVDGHFEPLFVRGPARWETR